MSNYRKFTGLVAAPFTPMDTRGKVVTACIPDYYEFLDKNEISGAFINGSTGEGPSLTQKEKQLLTQAWAECYKAGGRVRIINLVGGTSYEECIENAIFSMEAGISAIAVLAPYYFKPANTDALAAFVARVGASVPDLPVYFYHIPALTGVYLPMADFIGKITRILPNFAGIKYTHEDFMDYQRCLEFNGGAYDLLWGRDECLLSALSLGCTGAVGSTYNYAAPLYNKLIESFGRGDLDECRGLQRQSIKIVELLGKYGGMATGKAFMKYIGFDLGEFRSPVVNPDGPALESFRQDVSNLRIDNLFSVR
jgi:N-acetylneuraminate lyase